MNLLWEKGGLRIRDVHLFNENIASPYLTSVATSNECSFFTIPFVDGYLWSDSVKFAGLSFKTTENGKDILLEGKDPVIHDSIPGKLFITWPLKSIEDTLEIEMDEQKIKMNIIGKHSIKWFLDLEVARGAKLPFAKITSNVVECRFDKSTYPVNLLKGSFSDAATGSALRISPENNELVLDLSQKMAD